MYWRRVFRDALRETLQFYGLHDRKRAVISVLSLVGAIAVLRFVPGGPEQLGDEVRWAVALLVATAIMFVPVTGWHMLTIPAQLASEQRKRIERYEGKGDRVSQAISRLREYSVKRSWLTPDWSKRYGGTDDYAEVLLDCAEVLASSGINPPLDMMGAPEMFGMNGRTIRRVLARFRLEGIVEVKYRTVEQDAGYPYTEEDFYLSDFGVEVVARLEQEERDYFSDEDEE